MEMYVRNFLSAVFFKEVRLDQRLWLECLLVQTIPEKDIFTMSRVLLLMSSPAREDDWQFGVQWADHVEAIPATLKVASSRYSTLVCLLITIKEGQFGHLLPALLFSIFQTPTPWLPENVGSVLLLLDHHTCSLYLKYSISVCTSTCYKTVSTAVTGLALMTARARKSFVPIF